MKNTCKAPTVDNKAKRMKVIDLHPEKYWSYMQLFFITFFFFLHQELSAIISESSYKKATLHGPIYNADFSRNAACCT